LKIILQLQFNQIFVRIIVVYFGIRYTSGNYTFTLVSTSPSFDFIINRKYLTTYCLQCTEMSPITAMGARTRGRSRFIGLQSGDVICRSLLFIIFNEHRMLAHLPLLCDSAAILFFYREWQDWCSIVVGGDYT